jgi:hypothetical protein
MTIQWRYSGDGLIWVQIDDASPFPVHHSQWHDPETRWIILEGEIDDLRRGGEA